MTAKPAPRKCWESFARPAGVNQRRYEAVRAYVLEGAPPAEAAARFGYSRAALASLVRDFRAGKLTLFAEPGRPGRKSAPKKNAARGRVIELRRQGLSVYEISTRLAAEGRPLNRTGVGQILAEEGFGRLLRHPEPDASISPATAGTRTCPAPRSSTSPRSPPRPAPGWPGCCSRSPTWSPWTCPPWPAKPATPAPRRSLRCRGC
jgi:transposase